jgi:cell wall-associated NlpC family hydrolase
LPPPSQSPSVVTSPQATRAAGTAVTARLDAFLALATPTFHTTEGDVAVSIAFRMNSSVSWNAGEVSRNSGALVSAGRRAGLTEGTVSLVISGRASVAQAAVLAQALIDEGHLPPGGPGTSKLAVRVRQMMFSFGVGVDCAGYVQQAFLAAHDVKRSAVGLRPPLLENLSGLDQRGYVRVALSDVRTGDLFILQPPSPTSVGHTAIVRDAYPTTRPEFDRLQKAVGLSNAQAASGRWTTFVVDSSWGSGGVAQDGGVARRQWWHDTISDKWLSSGDRGSVTVSTGPYEHTIEGIFRLKVR